MENFDFSEMTNAVNSVQAEFEATRSAEAEYQAELDASIFETCEILRRMEKDSAKDRKWVIIGTCASIIAAVGTIAGIIISII